MNDANIFGMFLRSIYHHDLHRTMPESSQHPPYKNKRLPGRIIAVARLAARSLAANDIFRMAGATAFFTTFALPPMLMILVRTLGLFFSDRKQAGEAFIEPLRRIFGEDSTASILQTIRSFRSLQHNYLIAIGIFVFLFFVATTLFKVIRNAINQLWGIRPARDAGFGYILRSRGTSVAVMLAGGLLFLAVQLADAGQQLLGHYVGDGLGPLSLYLSRIISTGVATLISAVWFYLLFKFLPDGRPDNRIALACALLTGVLFTAGKAVLGLLLRPVQVSNFYGVSGAFALVLLFMFYSSIFLYAGAAVVWAWSTEAGRPVVPKTNAEGYHLERDKQPEAPVKAQ